MTAGVRFTGADFADLSRALKDADKRIQTEMRKAIRKAGESAVRDIRAEVHKIPSHGGSGTGVRAAIAAGTTVSISARGKSAGVTIKTTGSRLPAGKRPLVKAFNKASFRHPVFGRGWVNQAGHPYFGKVIEAHKAEMVRGMEKAMQDAADQIARSV